jgi:hypothetical protein
MKYNEKKPLYERVLVRGQSQSSWAVDNKIKQQYSFSNTLPSGFKILRLLFEKWRKIGDRQTYFKKKYALIKKQQTIIFFPIYYIN